MAAGVIVLLASAGVLFAQRDAHQSAVDGNLSSNRFVTASAEVVPRRVTVAQLSDAVEKGRGETDERAEKTVAHLELVERLSSSRLARLSAQMPGAKSKFALMAVGDASVFLEPPSSEVPDIQAPDASAQRQIIARAQDYLKTITPKLPDFYAKRITSIFEEKWTTKEKEGTQSPGALQFKGDFQSPVLYRRGKEMVRTNGTEQQGVVTRGTFGPVLSAVVPDNLRGPMQWHGWEEGPTGAMAVFEFQVSIKDSRYGVSFPMGGLPIERKTGYLGEIGIDPNTGTIQRLVLRSDPVLGFRAVEHADIMLEYGPVVIGGKTYTCLLRGVSISRARFQEPGIVRRDRALILLNDVVFTDYHVFRSEMRIIPN